MQVQHIHTNRVIDVSEVHYNEVLKDQGWFPYQEVTLNTKKIEQPEVLTTETTIEVKPKRGRPAKVQAD